MSEPKHIGVVREYSELIEVLRQRLGELNITHATLDRLTGLQVGYCGKILGEAGIRSLGPVSFGPMLQALALKIIVVEDIEAAQRMEGRWEECERPQLRRASRQIPLGKKQIQRAQKAVLQEMQKRSTAAKSKRVRRRAGRKAAKTRWAEPYITKVRRKAALARWAKHDEAEAQLSARGSALPSLSQDVRRAPGASQSRPG